MIQFDKAHVATKLLQRYPKLKPLGEITNISPAGQSRYGEFSRLTKVKLLGSTGKSDFLRAEDLRLTIDPTGRKLKSTICKIIKMGDKWVFLSGREAEVGGTAWECANTALKEWQEAAKTQSRYSSITTPARKY